MDRRRFLIAAATAATVRAQAAPRKLKVALFSKTLRFLEGEELAKAVAGMGFEAIDLTIRKGGHVESDRVAEDLPPLVKMLRAHGVDVPTVTSEVIDATTPHTETVLRTIADLGIRYYRWGGFKWDASPIPAQMAAFQPRIAKLAAMNLKYGVKGIYHTHSGVDVVGASIWDLYLMLKEFDPKAVAVNYDVGHATVEGGLGGWINSFRVLGPHLGGIAVKDFVWMKNEKGEWEPEWQPLGTGMVRFPRFFQMVAKSDFQGPLQLFFEYKLGGAELGGKTVTISHAEVFAAIKRDLGRLRGYLSDAGLNG